MDKRKQKELLKIAGPAVLESMVSVVIASIDTKMISVIGKPAISAVSFTTQPKLIVFSIFYALGTAVSVFVAQAYGKKDKKEGNEYFHSILWITSALSIVLGILLYIFARPVMAVCNRQPDTLDMSVTFFRIIILFSVFQALSVILNAALRGIGKTQVTLISNIAMGVVDIVVNYLLIEGHAGFPRLEVAGDAIATVLGSVAACVISMIAITRETDFLSIRRLFSFDWLKNSVLLLNIRSKAGNIVVENMFMRIGFLLSSIVLSGLSSSETAVYYVGMILLNYSFAFGDGIQNAVVALTGRSMGAKEYDDLKEYVRIAVFIGVVCSLSLSFIYIAGSRWFFGLFFSDADAVTDGVRTSYIAAVLTLLQIIRIISVGAMRGMGEVKDPRRIATVCVFILNPLLSLIFTHVISFGIWGIWLASVITQLVWFIMGALLCRKHLSKLNT